ncbi:MAG TPA: phage terminase large subunit, partial [Anaerolineales bacterium]
MRTKSGSLVRANARHPFLVERDGRTRWQRTATLRKGDHILRVTGGSGEARSAQPRDVKPQPRSEASASTTTMWIAGIRGLVHHLRTTLATVVASVFATATALPLRITSSWWRSRGVSVPCVGNPLPPLTPVPIGAGNSASITATRSSRSVVSSATTATSPSATAKPQKYSKQQQPTYDVIPDPIISITPVGVEDVFDIQVDRTENFIANGLVSHNTRWHQDDLFGRIIANLPDWTVVNIPSIAEPNDPLGRAVGDPLWPSFWNEPNHYEKVRDSTSPYFWSALHQGHPTPMGGGIIKEDWFHFYHPTEAEKMEFDQLIQSWDLSLKDKETSDWNVGQLWGRKGASLYLLDQVRGHYSLDQVAAQMRLFTLKHPKATAKLVEDAAMGPMLKQALHHEVPGIIPITPKGSKWARVQAVVPLLQAGNVYLPERSDGTKERWVWDLISECSSFPKGTNDDQVDALTQALSFLSPGLWLNAKRTEAAAHTLPEAT